MIQNFILLQFKTSETSLSIILSINLLIYYPNFKLQITWGDVVTMTFLELKQKPGFGKVDLLAGFPRLTRQYVAVRADPGVMKWLQTRPKTGK